MGRFCYILIDMSGFEALVDGVGYPFLIAFVLFSVTGFLILPVVIPFLRRNTNILNGKSWKTSQNDQVEELERRYGAEN